MLYTNMYLTDLKYLLRGTWVIDISEYLHYFYWMFANSPNDLMYKSSNQLSVLRIVTRIAIQYHYIVYHDRLNSC
ncbi:hypothetical protein QTP88_028761 [Uroleucon formosanum]